MSESSASAASPASPASPEAAQPAQSSASPPLDGKAGVSTAESVAVLKQNKSTGIKSSYYHFGSTPAHEAERYKPTLITDPSQLAAASTPQPILLSTGVNAASATAAPTAAVSRWNTAGTWEDCDVSSWAHDHFRKILTSVTVPSVEGKVTDVEKISGDCTVIFSRGKKKYGYDINATLNFTARVNEKSVKGSIEFPEIADSCADEPWQVLISIKERNSDNKKEADIVYDAFKKEVPSIRAKVDEWVKDFKAHV